MYDIIVSKTMLNSINLSHACFFFVMIYAVTCYTDRVIMELDFITYDFTWL